MNESSANDEWAEEAAREKEDIRRKAEPPPALDREEFLAWRSPRIGEANPTRMDHPLWQWLVRTRWDAYNANKLFNGPSPFDAGPMWCFQRYGMSETALPDGRVLSIGGEHEDYYDPDFFIYNDVTLTSGDEVTGLYGYPRSVFPPTDFHTATLIGDQVYLVGCLGYQDQRSVGATPVFRLSISTLTIERVETRGEPPGWIYRHAARLSDDGGSILVTGGEVWLGEGVSTQENIDTWALDITTCQWSRVTRLDWQRWTMLRVDRKPNRLWDTRQELWNHDNAALGLQSYWRHDDKPNLDAVRSLYRLDADAPVPEEGPDYNNFKIAVDGVTVRFTEEQHGVSAIVEGRLSDDRLQALQKHTLCTLAAIDGSDWEIEG